MNNSLRTRRIAVAVAALAASAAVTAPVATARPAREPIPVRGGPVPAPQAPPPVTVIRTVHDHAFDWGAAAIGGGTAAGLILLTLGGLAAGSNPRLRLTH
jgi:hypothetical protein